MVSFIRFRRAPRPTTRGLLPRLSRRSSFLKTSSRSCGELSGWCSGRRLRSQAPARRAMAGAAREAARRLAPEHRALGIAYYGSKAVEEIENSDPEKTYREGIKWMTEESERRFGKGFLALTVEQQTELLKSASDDRPEKELENPGSRFFYSIKKELVRGFYTSRAGLNELGYKGNTFYAESPGCPGEGYKKPAGGP